MNGLPSVRDIEVAEKRVLVRADLEWSSSAEATEGSRERVTKEIIEYLRQRGAERIKVIGHKGDISMVEKLGVDVNWDLRSDAREKANSAELAAELAGGWEVYVNEAFATSHRRHCSIDALPRLMRQGGKSVGAGLRFEKEIEVLSGVRNRKMGGRKVLVIGGAKAEDKARQADSLEKQGWRVLRGGLLPGAKLREDGLDISKETISNFQFSISNAQVIVLAGPMGKYEEAEKGTKEVFAAIAGSKAYKVAGGGDTEAALERFGLTKKFDWISVGGGACLEFLASGTLPGIEAMTV